jgi:hypothetical protein
MQTWVRALLPVAAGAALLLTASTSAYAQCVLKAGKGTAGDDEGAKFQAWEAVLQATDWGSWASFMATSQKVGVAPGYKVSNLKSKCNKGGLGSECIVQARLCK